MNVKRFLPPFLSPVIPGPLNAGSELLRCLTQDGEMFVFSYSPKIQSLTSWSENLELILGAKSNFIVRDANFILRYIHEEDRFAVQGALEQALRGIGPFRATYRWTRPDNSEVRLLHSRASLHRREEGDYFEGIILDITDEMSKPGVKHIIGGASLPLGQNETDTPVNLEIAIRTVLKRITDLVAGQGGEKEIESLAAELSLLLAQSE